MTLETLFTPSSIAVIGASRDQKKVGSRVLANIRKSGFRGPLFPINPSASHISGLRAYPTIAAAPGNVDVAVVCVPAAVVPSVLVECGKKGVSHVAVISSGFSEVGARGEKLEKKIATIASRYKMTLLGPNCLGFIHSYAKLNASFTATSPRQGGVSMVSQSGAIIGSFIDWANERHVGASALVSCGNAAGVQEVDVLEWMERDRHTRVIGMYLEEVTDVQRFLPVLSRVTAKKPVVILKIGKSPQAAKAALSHTGSLVASDEALRAAFKQCGATLVDDLEQYYHTLHVLQTGKTLPTDVLVLTNAGGPAIIAVDTIAMTSLKLLPLNARAVRALQRALPGEAAVANPVDLLGDADLERFKKAIVALDTHAAQHALCIIITPQAMTPLVPLARFLVAYHRKRKTALMVTLMTGSSGTTAQRILRAGGVPVYQFPNDALLALDRATAPRHVQRGLYSAQPLPTTASKKTRLRPQLLSFRKMTALLRRHEIPFTEGVLCRRVGDLKHVTSYPIVLKAIATTIVHKKQSGAILMPIHSPQEAKEGFAYLEKKFKSAALEGIVAQPLQKAGAELFIGIKREARVGTVISLGLGGSSIELLKDYSLKILPIHEQDARDMLANLRHQELLTNIDTSYILELLLRVSAMVLRNGAILELDLNPIIMYPKGGVIVDARIVYAS